MISDLTNTPRDLSLHTLFHDTARVTQTVIGSLTLEEVDGRYMPDILQAARKDAREVEARWPLPVMEEMLHPQNIPSRRGSISQIYRPSSGDGTAPSTPELRQTRNRALSAAAEEEIKLHKECQYLLNVLTMRKKQGGKFKSKNNVSLFDMIY